MWHEIDHTFEVHEHGLHFLLDGPAHDYPMLGFFDIREPDGRLQYHGWNADFHAMHADLDTSHPGAADLYVVGHPESEAQVWTQRHQIDWEQVGEPRGTPWDVYNTDRTCGGYGARILSDPDSILEDGLVWQEDTDLRFVMVDKLAEPVGHVGYELQAQHPTHAALTPATWWTQSVRDPVGAITTRLAPGNYVLTATGPTTEALACLEFTIVPNTSLSPPGRVAADLQQEVGDVTTTFTALGADDQPLPHYEFDTRVYRLDTDDAPGRLVWMGKLHAHHGEAAFSLHDLEPGAYEIITYPSPQDQDVPRVVADGREGFRWGFTIDAPVGLNATQEAPTEQGLLPGPAGFLIVFVLLTLACIARPRGRSRER